MLRILASPDVERCAIADCRQVRQAHFSRLASFDADRELPESCRVHFLARANTNSQIRPAPFERRVSAKYIRRLILLQWLLGLGVVSFLANRQEIHLS